MGLFDFFKKKSVVTAPTNSSPSKSDILKELMQKMSKEAPSKHFASGAIFDITRKTHDVFTQIVNSSDAMALRNYFAHFYSAFCEHPEIVGMTPAMIDAKMNDTNPITWNADVISLSTGEKIALCFMPISDEILAARIFGIVLGNTEDRYYYCMLNKDEDMLSDVIQNKAMLGIEKIGSVKGLGFELMNNFVNCIIDN